MSYNAQKKLIIVLFSVVPVALLLIFCYYPLVRMVEYSFTDWNGISKDSNVVFFDNYKTIFSKSEYFKVFKTSIYYFLATFVQMAMALYFATILSFKVKFKNFFKGAIFFPYLLNGVAIGFIFLYFFQPNGTLDTIMKAVGLGNYTQLWLGNPNIINISLAFTSIWRYMGGNFIIFLGTIQSIDGEIYEAAEIDGANRWRQFISIILPNIKRIVVLNIVLGINGALSVFEIPYIMTQGANGSKTFVIQTLDTGFKYQKLGLACSMAIVLLLISISVTLIQKKFLSEED
jgi:multiple sugar transport system permease protein